MSSRAAHFSLEYFPPKSVSAERALMTGAHALRHFEPAFQTVTFGADGSALDGSLDWPHRLQGLNDVPTASHITLRRFSTREAFSHHVEALWEQGIRHLVVLRGDEAPGENGEGWYSDVADGIRTARQAHDFEISVAAYPEVHPLAGSATADLNVLRDKQAAGASRAITQFFFDNDDFYRFRDRARTAGVTIELVPGIMPIVNFQRICGFAKQCGAQVPERLTKAFSACRDDRSMHSDVARRLVQRQVADLAANDVDAIHIYTMNRIDLTADAIRAFQAARPVAEDGGQLRRVA